MEDFSNIDFSYCYIPGVAKFHGREYRLVAMYSPDGELSIESATAGMGFGVTYAKRRADTSWKIGQLIEDEGVDISDVTKVIEACKTVDAFIENESRKKTWRVKDPDGYEWREWEHSSRFASGLCDSSNGKQDRVTQLKIELAREVLKQGNPEELIKCGVMRLDFYVSCERV